jgi:hypothetical protein
MSQPPVDPAADRNQPSAGTPASLSDAPVNAPESRGLARRAMLLAGLGALVGCASQRSGRNLPGAIWPETRTLADAGTPIPARSAASSASSTLPGVMPRNKWARGSLNPAQANKMTPCRFITIHHDGMTPFYGTNAGQVAIQIEKIRAMHVGNNRWADIGYHYVVDRSGRAWEARPITYQGAHVKDENAGNIGVLCLGNFQSQRPTQQQLNGLRVLLLTLSTRHRISSKNILTHQEWPSAATLCPGVNLQREIEGMRRSRVLG